MTFLGKIYRMIDAHQYRIILLVTIIYIFGMGAILGFWTGKI